MGFLLPSLALPSSRPDDGLASRPVPSTPDVPRGTPRTCPPHSSINWLAIGTGGWLTTPLIVTTSTGTPCSKRPLDMPGCTSRMTCAAPTSGRDLRCTSEPPCFSSWSTEGSLNGPVAEAAASTSRWHTPRVGARISPRSVPIADPSWNSSTPFGWNSSDGPILDRSDPTGSLAPAVRKSHLEGIVQPPPPLSSDGSIMPGRPVSRRPPGYPSRPSIAGPPAGRRTGSGRRGRFSARRRRADEIDQSGR